MKSKPFSSNILSPSTNERKIAQRTENMRANGRFFANVTENEAPELITIGTSSPSFLEKYTVVSSLMVCFGLVGINPE
jgi:hypothetical protein